MRNETCPYEARVLAARRAGYSDADVSRHLEQCPVCREISEVSEQIRTLGSLASAPTLPDPDLLWVRAQIAARQAAAARALRRRMRDQTLRYGLPAVGAAWLLLEQMKAAGVDPSAWIQTLASAAANPGASAAMVALAAFASGLVAAGLFIGRAVVARRLRSVGLW